MKYTPLRLIDIDNDEKKNGTIYVVNTINDMGKIVFECHGGRKSLAVSIEATWIPQDLSIQTRKSDIVESSDFRRLVSTGRIHLLADKDAIAILDTPDAKAEFSRIYKTSTMVENVQARSMEVSTKATIGTVTPKIMSIVGKSNGNEMSSSDAIASIRNGKITTDDMKYVLKTATDPTLKKFASMHLASNNP